MKVALAQLNYHIGNFPENTRKIISAIENAKKAQADLIVFAEMAIGGYAAKDLLRNTSFIEACQNSLAEIAKACAEIACVIGAPVKNNTGKGKNLFNSALLIEDGQITQIRHKTLLPDYDVFDEARQFEASAEFITVKIKDKNVALTICEDLWGEEENNSYNQAFRSQLIDSEPDLIINIAASPFSNIQHMKRLNVLKDNASTISCPLIYVNQVGAHADLIFDGRSLALNKEGELLLELKAFEEDLQYIDVFEQDNEVISITEKAEIERIHDALIFGIQDFFSKSGFKRAIIGLSGGLDSALVAALACRALGAENVLAVLMPSEYSTDHSIKDALDLVQNTGCAHHIVPINSVFSSFNASLAPIFEGHQADTTEENIQARTRGTILMALSNKLGYILLNTSNKSEAAVGYGTLYGDMAGSLSVIGDLYKTQAYELSRFINKEKEIIPINTIIKAPSAELRPDQKDADSLPDYELLDGILYQLIELEKSNAELINFGYDATIVNRIAGLLNNAEFKRFQAPPTLRISTKAFGPGRQMPLVAKYIF
ncbi:NAD+ synthase [Sphingobacterium sp. UT-1RO-CII-1]|uniref:NAD+ synthase n=1 Tax=Sphingobacterium sp. UT-1RO-CII-1 TaxID=2995225 RepID=UPI00227D4AED|nr:NAD+ synthase [Sphingobacterium sp. UT-1RO-CII-1]MCY4778347.1 NAD+ synthase [Sphingobacterium sp. UT-1RO-CII-1]